MPLNSGIEVFGMDNASFLSGLLCVHQIFLASMKDTHQATWGMCKYLEKFQQNHQNETIMLIPSHLRVATWAIFQCNLGSSCMCSTQVLWRAIRKSTIHSSIVYKTLFMANVEWSVKNKSLLWGLPIENCNCLHVVARWAIVVLSYSDYSWLAEHKQQHDPFYQEGMDFSNSFLDLGPNKRAQSKFLGSWGCDISDFDDNFCVKHGSKTNRRREESAHNRALDRGCIMCMNRSSDQWFHECGSNYCPVSQRQQKPNSNSHSQ